MIDLQTAPKCLAVEPSSAEPRFDPVAEAVAHVYRDYGSALRLLMGSTGPLLPMMDPARAGRV